MSNTPEILITFPGGKRVDADMFGTTIRTDQSRRAGGEGSAPEPFSLFLASIGTCAGIYVLGFLQARGLPTEGVELRQRIDIDPATRAVRGVELDIHVPDTVPAKYHTALQRAADQCAVKKTIQSQPEFRIGVVSVASETAAAASAN